MADSGKRGALGGLLTALGRALEDDRITVIEAIEIMTEAINLLPMADPSKPLESLVAFVGDLLHRDREELLAAAARQEAKGHTERAAKLRAKAERR